MTEYINPRAQACQNCVKAKAKCYGHNAGKCERCNRLNRECVNQIPIVRKRRTVKPIHQVQAERIAELEERLNGLVSVFAPSQAPSSIATESSPHTSVGSTDTPSSVSNSASSVTSQQRRSEFREFNDGSLFPVLSTGVKTPDELLDLFKSDMARQVPFIIVPPQTANDLARDRPFLYQAIVTVASYHDSVHQLALGQEFLRRLSEQLVLHGNRNLDMLQGLMVYISWYNSLFHATSQMPTMLGLVFSMIIDLNLVIPPNNIEHHEKFLDEMKGISSCHSATWGRRVEPSREEKRTILGCFYLFSCVSTNFCRLNPLRWTSYIQHCYEDTLNAPENENDVYLAHLAALARISEDIKHSGIRGFPSQPRSWTAAVGVHFKLLMSELQRFKASLPECLQDDVLMLMHYHTIEVYLLEIGFAMPPTTVSHEPTYQRADVLLLCLKATHALASLYLSINNKPYINFCPTNTTAIYLAMMTLSKLALFDAEDWDQTNLKTTLDLSTVTDRAATMLEEASKSYDLREDEKPWLHVSRRIRLVKVRFERLLASENRPSASILPNTEVQDGGFGATPYFLNQFDLLDDGFWQSLPDAGDACFSGQ